MLGEIAAGDDAELGGQGLRHHRHQIGGDDDPQQRVAVARAGLDVGREIAGVHVGDRGDDGWAGEDEHAHGAGTGTAGEDVAHRRTRPCRETVHAVHRASRYSIGYNTKPRLRLDASPLAEPSSQALLQKPRGREQSPHARAAMSRPEPNLAADALVATEEQVESFRQAREARRSALVEDYVELIADLIDDGGEARQVDIAARLGVAQPTVAKMMKRLAEDGLVAQKPYRGAFLTDAGQALALRSRERHRLVEQFLLSLGIAPETARRDAEGLEHHVSEETLDAFAPLSRPAAVDARAS